jgi:hypothetical protein
MQACAKRKVNELDFNQIKTESIYSWVCNMQQPNGLLLSFEGGKYVSLYDNALAAMSFCLNGDFKRAEKIFDFFNERIDSEFLVSPGGFSQMRTIDGIPVENQPRRWVGDNAWLLIALNNYHHLANNLKYKELVTLLTDWIVSLQDTDGGIWGGFNPDGKRISKIAEGNLDAFNAVPGYTLFHQKILTYFKEVRWDKSQKILIAWAENTQYKYALDLHSWGYCTLENFPEDILRSANRFLTTQESTMTRRKITGYCFDEDRDVVWLEGNGQMAVAFIKAKMEKEAQKYLLEMKKNIVQSTLFPGSYAIPYTANFGTSYADDKLWDGVDTSPAVSSTVWYLFAIQRFDPLELGYKKNIPKEDQFWIK